MSWRLVRRAQRAGVATDGFTLVEVMVAIAILSVVALALAGFFISSLKGTSALKLHQNAQLVADSDMELIHSLNPANLGKGRNQNDVSTQWTNAPSNVAPLLTSLDQLYDSSAAAGSANAVVPLTGEPAGPEATVTSGAVTPVIDGTAYTVTNYIGYCYQPSEAAAGGSGTNCSATNSPSNGELYDVLVAVSWQAPPGEGCANNICYYLDSALISPVTGSSSDPTINLNGESPLASASPSSFVISPTFTTATTSTNPASVTVNPLTGQTGSYTASTLAVTSGPANGTAVANSNGTITYTPNSCYTGSDTLTYSVQGTNGNTYDSTVDVTVSNASGNGSFTDPTALVASTSPTGVTVSPFVTTDCTSSTLTITAQPNHGTASANTSTGAISYTPTSCYVGSDTLTYTVKGANGTTYTGTAAFTDGPTTTAPAAYTDPTTITASKTPGTTTASPLTGTTGCYTASTVAVSSTTNGSATATGGVISYKPTASFSGTGTVTYTVQATGGSTYTSTANFDVTPVAGVGTATDTTASHTITIPIPTTSIGSGLTFSSVATPSKGTASVSNGVLSYTSPASGLTGTVTLTYVEIDTSGQTATSTITVTL